MEFKIKTASECIAVDMEDSISALQTEIDYWESQFEWACEINDIEGRRDIMKALNILNMWMDNRD